MAVEARPFGGGASTPILDWQKWARRATLDRVLVGLVVTRLSGSTVRVSSGSASVGGFHFLNTANVDKTSAPNSGAARYDRLVARITIGAGSTPSITASFEILQGAPQVTGQPRQLPALAQTDLSDMWEIPLAYWDVPANSSGVIGTPVNDGPGPGLVLYQQITPDSIAPATNEPLRKLVRDDTTLRGHPPVTQGEPGVLYAGQAGYYTVNFQAEMPGADTGDCIFIQWPAGLTAKGFFVGSGAYLSVSGWLYGGHTITPYVQQFSGAGKPTQAWVQVIRHFGDPNY